MIDAKTKQRLVASDPKSADLCKPYIQGQDINRWQAEWTGLWMLALKSSNNHEWPWSNAGDRAEALFASTYPAIHAHLYEHREALIKRSDQGEYWWELRACAYWDKISLPKIIYPDLTWRPSFSFEKTGALVGDTSFLVPMADFWVLAVLNSPVMQPPT